jgi:hypothetical protein
MPEGSAPDSLTPGILYDWDALGRVFGFKPSYLSAAGGMPVSAATDSVLLITHPGGGKSFDYADYWDGDDLIYKGRGQSGDQKRTGANLDVAENRRRLFVFEAAAPRQLRFLGQAQCVGEGTAQEPDKAGASRNVLLFRLRFIDRGGKPHATPVEVRAERKAPAPGASSTSATTSRNPRPFDRQARPAEAELEPDAAAADPAVTHALREKARQDHHDLVGDWCDFLEANGWKDIEEVPGAFDLRAALGGARVIFEMKTMSGANELGQCRSALAQLLEYRLTYGTDTDLLCVVTDAPISADRAAILDALGVAAAAREDGTWIANNERALALIPSPELLGAPSAEQQFSAAQRRLESVRELLARRASEDRPTIV